MYQIKLSSERFYLAIIFLAAIAVVIPIAFFGIPDANDTPQHFKFAQTYYNSLTTGDGFPSWAGEENFGYGDIGIRFYPPLEYYFLAFARIVVGNWYDAAWLTFLFWILSGCLGIYYWTRNWFPQKEATIAACFYAIIPFHLNQLYISFNNYSELAAASILTFCFAFLTRIFKHNKNSDVLGLAISFALLVLTHLPLTIIGSLSLFIYALTLLQKDNLLQPLVKCAIAFGVALLASSFYWVVMVSEMKWLNHVSDRFSSGRFSFDEGFFPFHYHAASFRDTAWIIDIACILTLLFLASPIIYFLYKKQYKTEVGSAKSIFQTVFPLGCLAFFMVTPLSRPLWIALTPLQKIQFPTRWMAIVAMCSAVVAAASVHYLLKGDFLKQRIWIYGCLIVLTTIAFYNFIYIFHPTSFVPNDRAKFEKRLQELPESQSFDCWWSIWAKSKALETKEQVSVEARQSRIIEWEAEERIFEVSEGTVSFAKIATFYYPHWQASVNGNSVKVEKDANGAMLIEIPAEKSVVKLIFQEPLPVRIASIFSILTWFFLLSAFLFLAREKLVRLRSLRPHFAEEEFSC